MPCSPKHQAQGIEQASPPSNSTQVLSRALAGRIQVLVPQSGISVAMTRELLRVGNRGQSVASGDGAHLSKALPTPERIPSCQGWRDSSPSPFCLIRREQSERGFPISQGACGGSFKLSGQVGYGQPARLTYPKLGGPDVPTSACG